MSSSGTRLIKKCSELDKNGRIVYFYIGILCHRMPMANCFLYKVFRYLIFNLRVSGRINPHDDSPVILVANHCGSFGPISVMTTFPAKVFPWVDHEVMERGSAAKRIQSEFLEAELRLSPRLAGYLGRLLGRICIAFMHKIEAIPVYAGSMKIKTTVERSLRRLEKGGNILIFPEDRRYQINDVFFSFRTGFIHLAKLYFEKNRKPISFIPIAVNGKTKGVRFGEPVEFDPSAPFPIEKVRLKRELETRIHELYLSLDHLDLPWKDRHVSAAEDGFPRAAGQE